MENKKQIKVILSKKGLDSKCSDKPIVCNKQDKMIFVPIPSTNDKCKYNDITDFQNVEKLFQGENSFRYNISSKNINKNIKPCCHLDPQLKNYFGKKYEDKFRASFGQVDGSQTFLSDCGISLDDVFLFFGWYYDADLKQEQNIIFGYLQVGAIITFDKNGNIYLLDENNKVSSKYSRKEIEEKYPFIINNPHWNFEKYKEKNNNTIYIARENFSFDKNIKGYGLLNYNQNLVLTDTREENGKYKSKTHWFIKDFEDKGEIKFKKPTNSLINGLGQIVTGFGQEFVFEENELVAKWAKNLIINNSNK